MHPFRRLVVSACAVAVIAAGVSAPVSAATPKLRVVNGFPGKVDVCLNGKEVRSGMPYGAKFSKRIKKGRVVLKYFRKDQRTCRGKLLGRKFIRFDFATAVLTKGPSQKVVVWGAKPKASAFDEEAFGTRFYHASDVGAVNVEHDILSVNPDPIEPQLPAPAATTPFVKGDSNQGFILLTDRTDGRWHVIVTDIRSTSDERLMRPNVIDPRDGKFYEVILVGTKIANLRFVVLTSNF